MYRINAFAKFSVSFSVDEGGVILVSAIRVIGIRGKIKRV
jgi:hypothetical protein